MDQIVQGLPPGWTPPAPASEAPAATETTAAEAAPSAQPTTVSGETAEPAQRRSERRHRHSGKPNPGNSAADPAAKKSTHST
jgi:hypothetical protein